LQKTLSNSGAEGRIHVVADGISPRQGSGQGGGAGAQKGAEHAVAVDRKHQHQPEREGRRESAHGSK
jgi:hypothetical protein